MKASLEIIHKREDGETFLWYQVKVSEAKFFWHYHPEYELTYIMKGDGKRLVGDSYESFREGDLVLLGPLLPHTWITERSKIRNCTAIVIQFSAGFIEPLLHYPEMLPIKKMLSKSNSGLHFIKPPQETVHLLKQKTLSHSSAESLSLFIQLLHNLTSIKTQPLSSTLFKQLKGNEDQSRINKVFHYINKDFTTQLSIKKAASLIHLSESAFCKFFKKVSGKTFSDYVNEMRIAYACSLLTETDKTIGQIAYSSGFDSLTYFNRVFLRKKRMTPRAYKGRE